MQNSAKTIVITGCSSGIGARLHLGLMKRGYRVVASCRHAEDVVRLQEQGYETIQLDLASSNSIQQGLDQIHQLTDGEVYGLVNNGAYGQPGAVIDLTRDVLRQQFETNVFGTQQLTNGILPMMLPHGQGRVLQISSVLGFICLKYRGAYNASKFALEALTDTMRLEHHDSGVKFSLIEPGPIISAFRRNALLAYQENIDRDKSMFRDTYLGVEKRLDNRENPRFSLSPEAVLTACTHALESNRPKIRYPVTIPTRIMAVLKRILSDRWMDGFLLRNSDGKK